MRSLIYVLVFAFFFPLPLQAAERAETPPAPAQAETRIETDEAAGVIRFIVKGREAAVLDEMGLRVRGDVDYGGTVTDIGTGSDSSAAERGAP